MIQLGSSPSSRRERQINCTLAAKANAHHLDIEAKRQPRSAKRPRSVSPDRPPKRPNLSSRQLSFSSHRAEVARSSSSDATSTDKNHSSSEYSSHDSDSFPSLYTVVSSLSCTRASGPKGTACSPGKRRSTIANPVQSPFDDQHHTLRPLYSPSTPALPSPYYSPLSTPPLSTAASRPSLRSRQSSSDSFLLFPKRLDMSDHLQIASGLACAPSDIHMDLDCQSRLPTSQRPIIPPSTHTAPLRPQENCASVSIETDMEDAIPSSATTTPHQTPNKEFRHTHVAFPKSVKRLSMGYKKGCEKCESGTKGHYTHLS